MEHDLLVLLREHMQLSFAYARIMLSDEAQILHLLQADLRHYRLLHNLLEAGLDPAYFHGDLNTAIFPLLGFSKAQQDSNALHDFYYFQVQSYMKTPLKEFLHQLPQLAREMLHALRQFQEEVNSLKTEE